MNQRNQSLGLRFIQLGALAQRQIAKSKTDAIADLAQSGQLIRVANGYLYRMTTAGAQILFEQLRRDPEFNGLQQRMGEMITLMVLQPHQFLSK